MSLKFVTILTSFINKHRNAWIPMLFIFVFIACSENEPSPEPIPEPIKEEYVFKISESYTNTFEKQRLGRNMALADFEPTGLYIKAGDKIEVNVEILKGNSIPKILIGTYSRYLWTWTPKSVNLREGKNSIINPVGKNAFIYIHYPNDAPNSEAKITIIGANKAAYFELDKTNIQEFRKQLEENPFRDAMLKSNKTIVVASRSNMLKYKGQDWNELLKTLDQIIDVEAYIDGLNKSSDMHIPNRNMYLLTESEDSGYWMAATWNRTFYNQKNAIDFVIDQNKLKADGWGPWHELGHQHQQSNITWPAVGEVTVNVYSLAVQRSFGLTSRLANSDEWDKVQTYMELPIEERDFNKDGLGAFFKLCLYQQLWLQYGDEFFINLHRTVREDALELSDTPNKMGYFMLKSSEVSQHNLSGFFKKWGFKVNESYYNALDDLNLPDPEIDLTTLKE